MGEEKRFARRRRLLLAVASVGTTLLTVGLLAIYAFSSRIADLLPQATWFVVLFVIASVAILFLIQWIARRYDL